MSRISDQRLAGLAIICAVCFFGVSPSASAQSQTTHYRSYSSPHYGTPHRSASRVATVEQKPHSVPSSGAPEALGKPSRGAAMSPNKELDQLERASVMKPMSVKRPAPPAASKSTLAPEKHSAPINFTHKELPQSAHSRPAKNR